MRQTGLTAKLFVLLSTLICLECRLYVMAMRTLLFDVLYNEKHTISKADTFKQITK